MAVRGGSYLCDPSRWAHRSLGRRKVTWSVLARIRHPERTVIRETCDSKTAGSSPAIVKASGALTVSMQMCNSCVLQGTLGKLVAFYYKT